MIIHKMEPAPSLTQTSFEDAITLLTGMNAQHDGPWKGAPISLALLLVCVDEQFTAARLVKHYEDLIHKRAYLRGGFIPPQLEMQVHYSARRGWWAVMYDRYMVWSPGV